jgi:hypothetical protein
MIRLIMVRGERKREGHWGLGACQWVEKVTVRVNLVVVFCPRAPKHAADTRP